MIYLLHGGPGAPGGMAPVARELEDAREPYQRRSGGAPLTVGTHVADLHELVDGPPTLVGHSWGAMLALCYAAAHPVERLVLVGCGTFDETSRAELRRLRRAPAVNPTDDASFAELGRRCEIADAFDPVAAGELLECDYRGHRETWDDMMRLQADGTYPAAFARITAPVTMLHGDHDPHPGRLIRDSLPIPHLEYIELERCGHTPWIERHAREEFFARLEKLVQEQGGCGGAARKSLRPPDPPRV
jgi:pimeloyl-ACP methyl ester carboxylesterase